MAHITGGGITENLPRILPQGHRRRHRSRLAGPYRPLFEHLQQLGNVEQDEMLRTFNMGIGLIAVIPAEKYNRAKAILERANEKCHLIGKIQKGDRKVIYQ